MNNLFAAIGGAFLILLSVLFLSTVGGTIVWATWDALLVAFPGLTAYVAPDLSWWT